SRRRHTRSKRDWSSDVCSSDLELVKFYTFLYRALGSPTVYSDVNGDFRSMEADEILSGEPDRKGSVEERETVNVADYDYTKPNEIGRASCRERWTREAAEEREE